MLEGSARQKRRSDGTMSATGLLGAFIAVVGAVTGIAGAMQDNILYVAIGIVMLILGASSGAKYK